MLKALVIDPGKCTGCKQCEMACSYENEGEFNVAKSRIRVFDFHEQGKMVPYTCTQCAEAWCQQACPVNAITTDPLSLRESCPREPLRRLQGLHDRLPLRHDQLQRLHR